MEHGSIAVEFDDTVWIDSNGKNCDQKDSTGFAFTHNMTHSRYFMVANELGSSVSYKGDGNFGSNRLLCEKGSVLKKIVQIKANALTY